MPTPVLVASHQTARTGLVAKLIQQQGASRSGLRSLPHIFPVEAAVSAVGSGYKPPWLAYVLITSGTLAVTPRRSPRITPHKTAVFNPARKLLLFSPPSSEFA